MSYQLVNLGGLRCGLFCIELACSHQVKIQWSIDLGGAELNYVFICDIRSQLHCMCSLISVKSESCNSIWLVKIVVEPKKIEFKFFRVQNNSSSIRTTHNKILTSYNESQR